MNTNQSERAPSIRASERQLAANRKNALQSTGPRTVEGKALVAQNGIGHGICALCPVIAEVESKREWNIYRQVMGGDLAPVGMLEVCLAERVIFTAWRLRRVAYYETEQIRLDQNRALERVGVDIGYELEDAELGVQQILEEAEWKEQEWRNVSALLTASDDTQTTAREANWLLNLAHEQLGLAKQFARYWQQLPDPAAWTAGLVRQLIRTLTEQKHKDFDEFVKALHGRVIEDSGQSLKAAKKAKMQIDGYRREHLLPGRETLEKVMRYESHLSRQFHRDLHELQRIQAVRQGQFVAAPIAIDVDVAEAPKAGGESPD